MRTRLAVLGAVVAMVALATVALLHRGPDRPRTLTPGAGNTETTEDPLAWDPDRRPELEHRAAAGLSHVIYAKSPGGIVASAARTASFRPLIVRVAKRAKVDPNTLEAIVMLESAGRPDAQASNDLSGAVGLTQILAETGQNLLGMHVDLARSARLTRGINRGHRVAARRAAGPQGVGRGGAAPVRPHAVLREPDGAQARPRRAPARPAPAARARRRRRADRPDHGRARRPPEAAPEPVPVSYTHLTLPTTERV